MNLTQRQGAWICFGVVVSIICIIIFHDPVIDYEKRLDMQKESDDTIKHDILNVATCSDLQMDIVQGSGHWLHSDDKFYNYKAQRWNELKCDKVYIGLEP